MTTFNKLPSNLKNTTHFCLIGNPEQTAPWAARILSQGGTPHHWNEANDHAELDLLVRNYWPELLRIGMVPDANPTGYVTYSQLEPAIDQVMLLLICDPDFQIDGSLLESFPELIIAADHRITLPECMSGVRFCAQAPLHLLPLVELVPQNLTTKQINIVRELFRKLGMQARVSDQTSSLSLRLQQVLDQEMEQIEQEGLATRNELQNLLSSGLALSWSTGDLESTSRNSCLIDLMKTQRHHHIGAGVSLADAERQRYEVQEYSRWCAGTVVDTPLQLYRGTVLPDWVDYNGHMSESFYLYAFGEASDALFRYIGIDEDYRASANSFYTVETHINYYQEASNGESLAYTTQILDVDQKRLHLFHCMFHGDSGELLCTTEQMLLHVDMVAAAACPIQPQVLEALQAIHKAHQVLPIPKQVGRVMAIKPRQPR